MSGYTDVEREVEDFAAACIRHGITPKEAIAHLRAAWGHKLDDLKRMAEYSFGEAER